MNIDEAIKDLSIQLEVKYRVGAERAAAALELGIEALKRIQRNRLLKDARSEILPGETDK